MELEALRRHGFGVAYRMLGSVSEAEDVSQEALLRLTRQEGRIDEPVAWMTTVATRLSINVLRSARARRESYVGPWLPEPLVEDPAPGPAARAELADSLSLALLVLLERLTPGRAGGLPAARGLRVRVRGDRRHHRAHRGELASARDAGAQASRGRSPALRRRRGRPRRAARTVPRGGRGGRPRGAGADARQGCRALRRQRRQGDGAAGAARRRDAHRALHGRRGPGPPTVRRAREPAGAGQRPARPPAAGSGRAAARRGRAARGRAGAGAPAGRRLRRRAVRRARRRARSGDDRSGPCRARGAGRAPGLERAHGRCRRRPDPDRAHRPQPGQARAICELSQGGALRLSDLRTPNPTRRILMSTVAATPFAGTYHGLAAPSTFAFAVRHSGVFWYRGSFSDVAATLRADGDGLVLEGSARVDSISVVEPAAMRASVLGPEFFDAERHPEITFRSTAVRLADDGRAEVDGELTIRGVTRPIAATGQWAAPRRGQLRRGRGPAAPDELRPPRVRHRVADAAAGRWRRGRLGGGGGHRPAAPAGGGRLTVGDWPPSGHSRHDVTTPRGPCGPLGCTIVPEWS